MSYELSICIPTYNGEKSLLVLVESLQQFFQNVNFEIIIVNDSSPDNVKNILANIKERYSNVKISNLSKNFGEYNAVMHGLRMASGQFIAIIDDDFQHGPDAIDQLYKKCKNEKRDCVFAKYEVQQQSFRRKCTSYLHNKLINYFIDKPKDLYLSTFKVISFDLLKSLVKYEGPFPNLEIMIVQRTNNISSCEVLHRERMFGESNYNLKGLLSLWFVLFLNTSVKPMRYVLVVGALFTFISLVYFSFVTFSDNLLSKRIFVAGVGVICSLIIFSLGLLGEYLSRMYLSSGLLPQSESFERNE